MFIDHLIAFKANLNAQRNNQFVYNKRIGSVKTILGIVIKRLEKLAQFFYYKQEILAKENTHFPYIPPMVKEKAKLLRIHKQLNKS